MAWVKGIFLILGTILLLAAIAPKIPYRAWWTRNWVYGRLQLTWAAVLLFILYAVVAWDGALVDWLALGLIVLSGLLCLSDWLPYTRLCSVQSRSSENEQGPYVRVLLINVLQDNEAYQKVCDRIGESQADIVFLCETNELWCKEIEPATQVFPYRYELPLEDYNGLLFYSKFEILDVEERYLCQDYIPSLTLTLQLPDNRKIKVFAIHPRPPRPEDPVDYLDKEIAEVAREASNDRLPCLIMGDLNEVGWSPLIRNIFRQYELFDPRRGRGVFNTYNAKWPLVRWPLDHVFHTAAFRTVRLERLSACGSDHFPMKFTLQLPAEPDRITNDEVI